MIALTNTSAKKQIPSRIKFYFWLFLSMTAISPMAIGKESSAPKSLTAESMKRLIDEMIWVEGGTFLMGSNSEKASSAEGPVHKVTLDGFYMGKFEVSQQLFQDVMGWDMSYYSGKGFPVNNVSWTQVQIFIGRLNAMTQKQFRLPTEAEWEYAAKGGKKSKGYQYSGSDKIGEVAWFAGNAQKRLHPSGKKKPNELGLYDMTGNLWEFCHDDAKISPYLAPYSKEAKINPLKGSFDKPYSKVAKITRGSGYEFDADESLVYRRNGATTNVRMPDIGFRLVMIGPENRSAKPATPAKP